LRPAWRLRPKDSPALSKLFRGPTGGSNCVAMTSTKKLSVSSARSSLHPAPSFKLLPPREGGLGGLTREALERATGSPEIAGNSISLQFDGPVMFDAWLEAISGAKRYVHFENYILRNDAVGRVFRDVLVEKAGQGVEIRLLYDWLGCWATPLRYWRPFRRAGIEVRAFNRPCLRDPYGVFQRDHRKLVVVDGEVAFAGGFCVGQEWAGTAHNPPWRDTGIEIRGPAVSAASRAFGRIWDVMGEPLPKGFADEQASPVGDTSAWLIEGEPGRSRVLRTVALVAAMVQDRLWITDPYFVAPGMVAEAMAEAARSGVDVRVLVPAKNNLPLVGTLSRAGYRYLLEQGVRLFEWQGGMIHAKTSVADGLWSRVGSSNLNAWSLLGNWELDVGVLDASLAGQLEGIFLADLASSSEIVLPGRRRTNVVVPAELLPTPLEPEGKPTERLGVMMDRETVLRPWRLAQLVRAGVSFSDALVGHRILGREDRTILVTVAIIAISAAVVVGFFPFVFGWALALVLAWLGIVMGFRAV
jgi:cardiolipin synthase